MEKLENNKMYQAIVELRTKGTLQEQAERLYNKERVYKKLIATYNDLIDEDEIDEEKDAELFNSLWLMKEKYEVRLNYTRSEMCSLNKRIIDTMKVLDGLLQKGNMDVEVFINTFNLDWDEYDETEDCYTNLLRSSTKVGHICRQGLIQNEEILKEMIRESEEDEIFKEMEKKV